MTSYDEEKMYLSPYEIKGKYTPEDITSSAIAKWRENAPDSFQPVNVYNPIMFGPMTREAENKFTHPFKEEGRLTQIAIIPVITSYSTVSQDYRMTVDGDLLAKARVWQHTGHDFEGVQEALIEKLGMSNVTGVSIVSLPAAKKARATTHKADVLYQIVDPTQRTVYETVQAGFMSQREAQNAAVALMNSKEGGRFSKLAVKSYTEPLDTDFLSVITRPEPQLATIKVNVTSQIPEPSSRPTEYAVRFWFSY